MSEGGWVYILASKPRGTLYIGVTSELQNRIGTHKGGGLPGFTKRYGVHLLVHLEQFGQIEAAIAREKQLKKWNRDWKINLIERDNPYWADLAAGWFGNSAELGQSREMKPKPSK